MIKYREILRLQSQGISQRGIAASCQCSRNTVSAVIQRADECGISWPFQKDLSDSELQDLMFPEKTLSTSIYLGNLEVVGYRTPKSKIFVLQATMRCLRSIGSVQETGSVYLSNDNVEILNEELKQNFRLTVDELKKKSKDKKTYKIHPVPPPVKITMKRVKRLHQLKNKKVGHGVDLELTEAETEKYKLIHTVREGLETKDNSSKLVLEEDLTSLREKRTFSQITLVAEIARYLNRSCLEIEEVLQKSKEGMDDILKHVNEFNELIYDWIIPKLFNTFYELISFKSEEEQEIELVRTPEVGYYEVKADPELVEEKENKLLSQYADKSFHLDTYCFDSKPERELFWQLLNSGRVKKLYFTGMLTHGQSDFYIQYIDPESHTVRSYYPDFLVQKDDGSWLIVEVKGDNKIDDPVVLAKADSARMMAVVNSMTYQVVKGSEALAGEYDFLLKG